MSDNLGGIPAVNFSNKLILTVTSTGALSPTVASGTATNTIANIYNASAPIYNLGVPGAKSYHLVANGYGSSQPADTNNTPEGRANNRRVEVKILGE